MPQLVSSWRSHASQACLSPCFPACKPHCDRASKVMVSMSELWRAVATQHDGCGKSKTPSLLPCESLQTVIQSFLCKCAKSCIIVHIQAAHEQIHVRVDVSLSLPMPVLLNILKIHDCGSRSSAAFMCGMRTSTIKAHAASEICREAKGGLRITCSCCRPCVASSILQKCTKPKPRQAPVCLSRMIRTSSNWPTLANAARSISSLQAQIQSPFQTHLFHFCFPSRSSMSKHGELFAVVSIGSVPAEVLLRMQSSMSSTMITKILSRLPTGHPDSARQRMSHAAPRKRADLASASRPPTLRICEGVSGPLCRRRGLCGRGVLHWKHSGRLQQKMSIDADLWETFVPCKQTGS